MFQLDLRSSLFLSFSLLFTLLTNAGCTKEMTVQNRPFVGENPAYEIPPNTRPAALSDENKTYATMPISEQALARGHERYEIYCTPCHDQNGTGNGRATKRGFPKSAPLAGSGSHDFSDEQLVAIISDGIGIMRGYGNLIPLSDKRAIAAYIRHLESPSEKEAK